MKVDQYMKTIAKKVAFEALPLSVKVKRNLSNEQGRDVTQAEIDLEVDKIRKAKCNAFFKTITREDFD